MQSAKKEGNVVIPQCSQPSPIERAAYTSASFDVASIKPNALETRDSENIDLSVT